MLELFLFGWAVIATFAAGGIVVDLPHCVIEDQEGRVKPHP